MENWTSEDARGHAADVWGPRAREFKSRWPDQTDPLHPTYDLRSTDILAALDNAS